MKKLFVGIVCVGLIVAGYGAELGTRSGNTALHANANSPGPTTRLPPAPFDQSEEDLSAAETEVLPVGTLIALTIVAAVLSTPNHCATPVDARGPHGRPRLPAQRTQMPC